MYVHMYASADGEKVCIRVCTQVAGQRRIHGCSQMTYVCDCMKHWHSCQKYPPMFFLTFTLKTCGVGSNRAHFYAFYSSYVFCAACDSGSPTTGETQKIGGSNKRLWREAQSQPPIAWKRTWKLNWGYMLSCPTYYIRNVDLIACFLKVHRRWGMIHFSQSLWIIAIHMCGKHLHTLYSDGRTLSRFAITWGGTRYERCT